MGGLDPGLQIHGNPGDYAWGRGGLDTIITQVHIFKYIFRSFICLSILAIGLNAWGLI